MMAEYSVIAGRVSSAREYQFVITQLLHQQCDRKETSFLLLADESP